MSLRPLMLVFFLLLACLPARPQDGPVLKVCKDGCPYSTVQSAVDAAAEGGIIEIAAGEIFKENVAVIGKHNLVIRTSRWEELPPVGYRVDPAGNAELLATIRTPNNDRALSIGASENGVTRSGVDISGDTITFEYAPAHSSFTEGSAISCVAFAQNLGSLPAPMEYGRKYFIRDWDAKARRGRIAETPDGAAIDLTSTGSASSANYYARPLCVLWDQSSNITVEGIRFDNVPGVSTFALVQIGHNMEADRKEMGPSAIEFRHVVITGVPDDSTGPLLGMSWSGYDITLRDSWVGHCKVTGAESKAIAIGNVSGGYVLNNYLSAASINLLTGGGDSAAMDVNRDLVITGNFFDKPGYMMYKEGADAPTGECYYGGGSGAFYRRTSVTPNTCANEACYTCSSGNHWQLDTNAFYRKGNYLTKNLLELKDCENCRIEGNYFRGSYAGPDSGQGWCLGISVVISRPGLSGGGSGYHHAYDVTFRNNWADYCYSGVNISHSAYGIAFDQIPLKNIVFENNLLSNMGWYPAMTQFPNADSVQRIGLKQSTGVSGFRFVNNTLRARSEFWTGVIIFPGIFSDRAMPDYTFENNLISYHNYAFRLDSAPNACSAEGLFQWIPNNGKKHFRNNVFFGGDAPNTFLNYTNCAPVAENTMFESSDAKVGFLSPADHRLSPASPYSAANLEATLKLHQPATGGDLGADIDMIEQYALPAQKGEPPMPEQLAIKVLPDTMSAQLRFHPSAASCQVTLFSDRSRLPRAVVDTRMVEGNQEEAVVQFGADAGPPLTPRKSYFYRVDCGSLWSVGSFETVVSPLGVRKR